MVLLVMNKWLHAVVIKIWTQRMTHFFTAVMTAMLSGKCCSHSPSFIGPVNVPYHSVLHFVGWHQWFVTQIVVATAEAHYLPPQSLYLISVNIQQVLMNVNGYSFFLHGENLMAHLFIHVRCHFGRLPLSCYLKVKKLLANCWKVQPLLSLYWHLLLQ